VNESSRIIDCLPPRKGDRDPGYALLKRTWYVWIPIGLLLLWLASR
jgi:hypothetical protein